MSINSPMISINFKNGCKEIKKKGFAIQSNLYFQKKYSNIGERYAKNKLPIRISAQAFPLVITSY